MSHRVENLDVLHTQNIWGSVTVTRNQNLLAGEPTNPAFVYQVERVRMPAPAVPLYRYEAPFDVASIPPVSPDTEAPSLLNRLVNLFAALLDLTPSGPAEGDRRLRFDVSYVYRLSQSATGPGIETRVPVLARPNYQFDPSRDLGQSSGLCRQLAQALSDWYCSMRPSTQGAAWVLDISLYTTLAGTGSSQPPLLHLTELRLALADLAEGELVCPREPLNGHGRAG